MGKNQHVVPHPDGGWQVKGEELPYVLSHKEKQLMWRVLFHRDKVRNWLFTVQMVRYGIKILMDMILSRRRVNIRERHTVRVCFSSLKKKYWRK